ncbi:hypothetical protein ACFQJD_17500 [Haloplanus sp. GCM10025708]|uniref:hypothetical protein n=1 Tax=Haloferacaceae TaxID=1644056 RepID=UPI00360EF3C0
MSDFENEAAERVIRVLSQAGVGVSPGGIAANLAAVVDDPPSESAVCAALDELERRDLVRRLDGAYYLLTDHGRDYVEREFEEMGVGFIE